MLVSINLTRIISGIEGKSEVVVQIKDGTDETGIDEIEEQLGKVPNVKSIEFYSKEDAWESMLADMTEDEQSLFQYADDNPLPDTFKVTVVDIKKMSETTSLHTMYNCGCIMSTWFS